MAAHVGVCVFRDDLRLPMWIFPVRHWITSTCECVCTPEIIGIMTRLSVEACAVSQSGHRDMWRWADSSQTDSHKTASLHSRAESCTPHIRISSSVETLIILTCNHYGEINLSHSQSPFFRSGPAARRACAWPLPNKRSHHHSQSSSPGKTARATAAAAATTHAYAHTYTAGTRSDVRHV